LSGCLFERRLRLGGGGERVTQTSGFAEDRLRSMLEAFAGPPAPLPTSTRAKRHATRRTLVVCVIVLVALIVVPVGWTLLSRVWETPTQFLNDPSQPASAKRFIRSGQQGLRFLRERGFAVGRLRAISHLMSAPTPEGGSVQLYVLRSSDGTSSIYV